MSEVRLIKKYPNRRLYDTAISSYITLEDVRQLIIECTEFKVIDAKTQEDLTHTTLLQIISEQENGTQPLLTNQVLQELIRSYGHSMQNMMSQFLEQSVQMMKNQQAETQKQWEQIFPVTANPLQFVNKLAEQNMTVWQSLMSQSLESINTNPVKETEEIK